MDPVDCPCVVEGVPDPRLILVSARPPDECVDGMVEVVVDLVLSVYHSGSEGSGDRQRTSPETGGVWDPVGPNRS